MISVPLPPVTHFKRVMPNIRNQEGIDENSFWIIVSYGRTFWNIKEQRYYKEVILINAPDDSYVIKNWNYSKIIKSEIPEEKTFLFQLGSLIDTSGKFISLPDPDKNFKIYSKSGISVHPKYNYHTDGLYEILKDSSYPLIDSINGIYDNAPYYKALSFDKKTEVIIPIHVITSYFYYLSTLCIYHIIYDTIKHGILKEINKEGKTIVPFSSSIIRHEEAKILAKYMFINGHKKINYLRDIPKNLLKNLYNGDKFNHQARFYLKSEIPFNSYTKFNFIGQYITDKEGPSPRKFIAHGITNVSLFKGEKLFSTKNYLLYDISNHRSIPVENPESIEKYNSIKYLYENNGNHSVSDSVTNHNAGVKDLPLIKTHGLFLDSPENNLIEKTQQKIKYEIENSIIKKVNDYSDNIRNHSSSSTSVRGNVSPIITSPFHEILNNVVSKLNAARNYSAKYIVLKYHNGNFSYPPIGLEILGSIIIVSISYNDKKYCLIDSGYQMYIALFRFTNPCLSFLDTDDPTINDVITEMVLNQSYNWDKAYKNDTLKDYHIHLLQPLKHPKHEYSIDEATDSLLNRIKKRIENDF
ncbi:hypothetical protein [Tenacibaculum discolor]|uniref:hypothetical protein n=1 Tax=Tenacibaculum discolor TaxID=361581 RepID=UPI000EAC9643|nr:hypothetical protein [Tenacibaculum discolor]RLJ98805.1 hypothetical protein C8N27_2713 [Tenacibaculum discolor]